MTVHRSNNCAHCGLPIEVGQRWVREKVYDPSFNGQPTYHRYHVELFNGQELSCWEKYQMEKDTARVTARRAA